MTRRTRIAAIMGTRPEAIKMAPVVAALKAEGSFETVVVSTGQHREMIAQVADLFQLRIDHDLAVMLPNQHLTELTARLLTRCDALLEHVKPDLALAQGDTSTVLSVALACAHRRIPFGHIEAGLRTGNRLSPFPEEINRSVAARLAELHFAPTANARDNLLREGIDRKAIFVTGNTVIDALHAEVRRQEQPSVRAAIAAELRCLLGHDLGARPYVLVTGHRRESFGRGFEHICEALATLACRFADHDFVYPVHLNPNVQGPVRQRLSGIDNVRLLPPLAYRPFVALMAGCHLVLTDSGGIQEEAPSLGKPVLVLRDTTERPEGVEVGTVRLVGTRAESITREASILLTDEAAYQRMASAVNPYGDGRAAERIVRVLRSWRGSIDDKYQSGAYSAT